MIPKKVNVIKVPLASKERTSSQSTEEITRMPRMYLELIENKDKIKPSVVNKEYDPEEAQSVYSFDMNHPSSSKTLPAYQQPNQTIQEEADDEDIHSEQSVSSYVLSEEDNKDDDDEKSVDEKEESDTASTVSTRNSTKEPSVSGSGSGGDTVSSSRSSKRADDDSEQAKSQSTISKSMGEQKNKTRDKLRKLLSEEMGTTNHAAPSASHAVPKLSELHERGQVHHRKTIPTFHEQDTKEDEDELKRELLFKFELLKKSYKNVQIPEFTMYSDYRNMNQTYENTLRQVSLDSNVESYKSLLVGGCMLLEFILGFWLKFDMSGFTQQQILNMNQYERLLIELGEKSYMPGGSQWPVELRLLGLLAMNAIIFIISKMILKKTGSNLVGLMNSVNHNFTQATQKPKRRMRGPAIDVESIPDE